MRSIIKILALTYALVTCSCTSGPQYRLIHDDDGDSTWDFKHLSVAKIDSAISFIAGSGITSYAVCAGSDYVHYGSQYADSSFLKRCPLGDQGVDFLRTVMEKAHEHGLEAILTYRMNDMHFTDTLDVPEQARKFNSKWWWDHPQFWIGQDLGWHTRGAYDFAHKEVRDHKVAMMTEQVEMYGEVMDVYLMDFLRFFCYFKEGEGPANAGGMTDMVRRMRAVTDSVGKARGRKILLAARVAPVMENNLDNGLDVRQWLKEGLVDFLSLGIHCILDGQTPVAAFKKELGRDLNVPVYACGCDIAYNYDNSDELSEGMIRAWCSNVLSQGADGLQSFNYYFTNATLRGEAVPGGLVNRTFTPGMYGEVSFADNLEGRNKVYWLSDGTREYGLIPDTVLPLDVAPGGEGEAVMYVGDRMKKGRPQEVILFYRTSEGSSLHVTLNGVESIREDDSLAVLYNRNTCMREGEVHRAVVFPSSAVRHAENTIVFGNDGDAQARVTRTELALGYGPVEECGYF